MSHYNLIMLTAMMSLLYWGCLRVGELATSVHADHVLDLDQVVILRHSAKDAPHALLLNFKSFKHSRGRTPSIILKMQPHYWGGGFCCLQFPPLNTSIKIYKRSNLNTKFLLLPLAL